MLETYRSFQRENLDRLIEPYAGCARRCRGCASAGMTLGLVTSKVEWAARLSYERYGLDEFLSVLVFHDDTRPPQAGPASRCCSPRRRRGSTPPAPLYVGDAIHDMAAGRAAGMKTIGALWGPSERDDLERAGADVRRRAATRICSRSFSGGTRWSARTTAGEPPSELL